MADALRVSPALSDVASEEVDGGLVAQSQRRSRHGRTPRRHDAGRQRCPEQRLRTAPGLDHLRAGQSIPRRARSGTRISQRSLAAEPPVRTIEHDRHAGSADLRRDGAVTKPRRSPSAIRISSRRSRSASIWRPTPRSATRLQRSTRRSRPSTCRPTVTGTFYGDAAEFSKSLQGQPWLILAAIVTIYIVLGVLYESLIHPVHDFDDAALGRHRRGAGARDHRARTCRSWR